MVSRAIGPKAIARVLSRTESLARKPKFAKRAIERECLATIRRRVCCDNGRMAAYGRTEKYARHCS